MRLWIVGVIVLGITMTARADVDVDVAIGYSHLTLSGSDRFQERDGLRLEPRVSVNPFDNAPELRLGFGLGVSGYTHDLDSDTIITVDNGRHVETFRADQSESLSLLEPEFQLSWREHLGDGRWFVEPGVGIGAAIADYGIVDHWWWDNEHDSQWDATFEVRPFVRLGYSISQARYGWSFGGEVSYMIGGNLNLTDQVQGDLRELFAGGFVGFTW